MAQVLGWPTTTTGDPDGIPAPGLDQAYSAPTVASTWGDSQQMEDHLLSLFLLP